MPTPEEEYKGGLEPKAREVLELLRANPGKEYTVMEIYGSVYSAEEKSKHTQGDGGLQTVFKEIQGWLNEFCERGYAKSKRVATSFFYRASE